MTKYIASFAILSGAQLGSRIWPDWQKSSAALLLPLPSFPIDKRTESRAEELRTTSLSYRPLAKAAAAVQ